MLVDDDADITGLYEFVADIPDTIFTIQNGGLSALRFLNNLNYDVDAIVLDLSMPDMDGISLTERIREQEHIRGMSAHTVTSIHQTEGPTPPDQISIKRHRISIFWFTGWTYSPDDPNDPVAVSARRLGVVKIYQKPVDPVELIVDVRRYLDEQKLLRSAGSSGKP